MLLGEGQVMGEKEKRIALLGANNPFFILLDSCTFLPCSSRTRSRRRYCAIFSLTFSSSFYLSVICYYCYPFWHPSLGMRVNSYAKVRRFSTKNKQNTELFALTASFLMLVNMVTFVIVDCPHDCFLFFSQIILVD